jgi:hypothetical protein
MRLIQSNPYRIIDLLGGCSEREFQKQKSKIKRFLSIGKSFETQFDFSFLEPVERNESIVNKAFSELEQNFDKVKNAIFWFINVNSFDQIGLEALIKGDEKKAIEEWEKITNKKKLNSKNYSSFNNVSTLYLLSKNKETIKKGIEFKLKLIESEFYNEFVNFVADSTFIIDRLKESENFIEVVLNELKNEYSEVILLNLFEDCSENTRGLISSNISNNIVHYVESQIEKTKNNRKQNPKEAYDYGKELHDNCKPYLDNLILILENNEIKYSLIADNLSKEIMQCGIDFFNELHKISDPSKKALKLLEKARSIAIGQLTIDAINSNINSIEDFVDFEINHALEFLNSVKETFEENKRKINVQVFSAELGPNQNINWRKVNKIIDESINWDKVVEHLIDIIPFGTEKKIESVFDKNKLDEFKILMDFLFEKLTFEQIKKVKHLYFWKTKDLLSNIVFTIKSLPHWIQIFGIISIVTIIVGFIWGQDGIEVIFSFFGVVLFFLFLAWIQNK